MVERIFMLLFFINCIQLLLASSLLDMFLALCAISVSISVCKFLFSERVLFE